MWYPQAPEGLADPADPYWRVAVEPQESPDFDVGGVAAWGIR